jgi:hypothetical protein
MPCYLSSTFRALVSNALLKALVSTGQENGNKSLFSWDYKNCWLPFGPKLSTAELESNPIWKKLWSSLSNTAYTYGNNSKDKFLMSNWFCRAFAKILHLHDVLEKIVDWNLEWLVCQVEKSHVNTGANLSQDWILE